jgi:two-component system sensor histidine kinase PilS (NtrC family)
MHPIVAAIQREGLIYMDKSVSLNKDVTSRLGWLLLFRVLIVSFLLGIAAFIQIKGSDSLSQASLYSLFTVIGITYLFSIIYVFLLKVIKDILFSVYIQCVFDILLITLLVYATGGIESVYSTLYPLVIIYSVIFLGRKGGILTASASSIFYGVFLNLEFYGVLHPIYSELNRGYDYSAGYVFSRIFIYVVSFGIVALLGSFVVEKQKRLVSLLSEKEDAFDQLDFLYSSIVESVSAGIMTIDLGGRVKSFNSAAEEITGHMFSRIKDRNINDIFSNVSELIYIRTEGDRRSVKRDDRKQNRFEAVVSHKDGRHMVLGFSFSPLIDRGGAEIGKILIFQDLTHLKEMEEEVEKSKRLAMIGEMSAVLAHELRNPLASISGSVQLLKKDLKLTGTDEKLMDIVLRGKDHLENLARDFLLLARPNLERRSMVDIKEIIDDVIESVRFGPDWNEDVTIETTLCEQNEVYGNDTEIRQVFLNIIVNALQSMPDGGKLAIKSMVLKGDGNQILEITITDTGCGIEKENLKKIQEPFYTTKEMGTGLGLAIVSRVIESNMGEFKVESEVNGGTVCTISIPRNFDRRL